MKRFLTLIMFLFLTCTQSLASEKINIAYTIDNNYPIFTMISINSIVQNNKSDCDYTFYIIEDNISQNNLKLMKDYFAKKNINVNFIHIDQNIIDTKSDFTYLPYITPISLARILLPDLLPQSVDKVLYLDGDTLVTIDLKEFYDIELEGDYLTGMIPNDCAYSYEGITKKNPNYYNSGVMLIDLKKWREQKVSKQLLDFMTVNKARFSHEDKNLNRNWSFIFLDQDLINYVLDDKIKTVSFKYNQQYCSGDFSNYEKLFYTNGVLHYLTATKPWVFAVKKIEAVRVYYKYWNNSGLKRYKYYYLCSSIKRSYELYFNSKMTALKMTLGKLTKKGDK